MIFQIGHQAELKEEGLGKLPPHMSKPVEVKTLTPSKRAELVLGEKRD